MGRKKGMVIELDWMFDVNFMGGKESGETNAESGEMEKGRGGIICKAEMMPSEVGESG